MNIFKLNFKLFLTAIALVLIFPFSTSAVGTLMDFDDGQSTEYNPINGQTRGFDDLNKDGSNPDCCTHEVVSPGLLGSNYCLRSYVANPNAECNTQNNYDAHSNHNWREDNDSLNRTQGIIIQETAGADRLSYYALFPELTANDSYNYDVGTYTQTTGQTRDGIHYYHTFSISSDGIHPTHLVCNKHPQNRSGAGNLDPDYETADNPTTVYTGDQEPTHWDYMEGLTRLYFQLYEDSQPTDPYYIYYDNFEFYAAPEPENTETINSIWVGYFGSNNWQFAFAMNCQHIVGDAFNHTYQVRYSTSPITNANFSSATLVGNYTYTAVHYNQIFATFSINDTDTTGATHYYFAVDDLDDGSAYVTKIDYEFVESGGSIDATPPSTPTGLSVS